MSPQHLASGGSSIFLFLIYNFLMGKAAVVVLKLLHFAFVVRMCKLCFRRVKRVDSDPVCDENHVRDNQCMLMMSYHHKHHKVGVF